MATSLTCERGVGIDRGYVRIRFWPWGRANKPYLEYFGPETNENIKIANYKMREYRNKVAFNKFDIEKPAIPMLFKDGWPIFLKNHKASLSTYTNTLCNFFGSYWIHDISPQLVIAFRKAREKEGVSFATINKNQAILSSVFARFKAWNEIGGIFSDKVKIPAENPCQAVVKPTERHRARKRVLAPEEWERLSPSLEKTTVSRKNQPEPYLLAGWLLDHCKMALYSSLSLKDISKFSGMKAIPLEVLEGVRSKTNIPYSLPLTESLRAIALRIAARPYITACVVQKYFKLACDEAGVRDCTFRDLRRTGLRWMDKQGTRRTVVRDRAAHGDIKTTEGYLGSDLTEQLTAIKGIEDTFR